MILQEDTCRAQSKSAETVKTGAYKPSSIEYAWDINDSALPKDIKCEEFHEWPNGHCKHVYTDECEDARKHMSNWAMRNTNNHNVNILKKSCLGVLVCGLRCSLESGDIVHVRPAICDKARRKQLGKQCPNTRCSGRLELQPCRGHGGYPVTHFWRHVNARIFFQAKGEHDHPHPEAKSSAEARRQRYAMKENRGSLISRHKERKRSQSMMHVTPAVPIKQEPKAALHQYPAPAKVRRVCGTCAPYDCHCAAYSGYSSAADPLTTPLAAHDYKLLPSSAKDSVVSSDSVHDFYAAQNAMYYYNQYNSGVYPYESKTVGGDGFNLYGNVETSPQWTSSYPYVTLPSTDTPMHSPEFVSVPPTSAVPEQYYIDPYLKNGSQQYSKPCMYEQQLLEYQSTVVDPVLTNTVTNSLGTYDTSSQDKKMSPPVGDTFIQLQRSNSYPATSVTPQHRMTSHSNPDLHGNMSPYHQSTHSPSSHEQSYLVSSDSPVSQESISVPQDDRLYCNSVVSAASFQVPALAAAVGTGEHCSAFKVLSEASPPPPSQNTYVSQHY